jgi:hypothetical protein
MLHGSADASMLGAVRTLPDPSIRIASTVRRDPTSSFETTQPVREPLRFQCSAEEGQMPRASPTSLQGTPETASAPKGRHGDETWHVYYHKFPEQPGQHINVCQFYDSLFFTPKFMIFCNDFVLWCFR